ncbi:MAG: KEOPS complex subunit Pcc1 [Vulcanisaeta sp.]|jgi:hypothetical protein|uniref:KEOPS complex subunit Pcc1 n=1 Tax=Vulcanisaeta sp. TaxID=2020871 RepID=UPI003D09A1F0
MKIRGRITLEIAMKTIEDCQVAISSLLPDERELPQGLTSTIKCIDDKLTYELTYHVDNEKLLSVYNTIDDFIRNLKIIMESLSELRR